MIIAECFLKGLVYFLLGNSDVILPGVLPDQLIINHLANDFIRDYGEFVDFM